MLNNSQNEAEISTEEIVTNNVTNAVIDKKTNLIGHSKAEIAEYISKLNVRDNQVKMRVNQLWQWLYLRGATNFELMSNISKALRVELDEFFTLKRAKIITKQLSSDGTIKWLLEFPQSSKDKSPMRAEMVYIPEDDRGTLCISSQIGCSLNCSFCHTGTQRFVRNLGVYEIVCQVMLARDELDDHITEKGEQKRRVTNIVFMGMGEPLYNFDNVKHAVDILTDGDGLNFSRRRVTVSTAGVVPKFEDCGNEINAMLAVSLHATNNEVRDKLVPLNMKYNLDKLMEACRNFPGSSNSSRITFEYIMIKGMNDSIDDAKRLVNLLARIPSKVNLIPFNKWPGCDYECSDYKAIDRFQKYVHKAGIVCMIRTTRGADIMAACGQLKSASKNI